MAYYYGRKSYGRSRSLKSSKKRKRYTQAERIAFKLGQEQKVRESIYKNGNHDTRVFMAYSKGYQGAPMRGTKKPLFGN